MSTPIDPPLSRRAARQSEVTAQDAPPESFAQPLTRRARANAPASVPSSAPGEVSYRTEVRPRVPHYDTPPAGHAIITPDGLPMASPGSLGSAAAPTAAPTFGAPPLVEPPVAPSAAPAGEQMRRRDFRPPAEQQPVQPDYSAPPVVLPGGDAPLDYHTHMTVGVSAPGGYSPAGEVPMSSAPVEQTLSRRELRELRDRAGLPGTESPAALSPAAPSSVAPSPVAPSPVFGAPQAPARGYESPQASAPTYQPPQAQAPVYEAPVREAPVYEAPVYEQPMTPAAVAPPAVPNVSTSESPSPSTGSHWSVGIHDDEDPFENTFSREVGSAVSLSNTNALVLPEMPMGGISGPVAGTGEIIITGMIDVPRVVSSTGTVPTVHESPDIDDHFDPGDLAAGPADAAPVSALKAVSSHTAARSIITTGKRSSSNAVTTVLVATTVVMAVVAIGLFVLAAVNGLF